MSWLEDEGTGFSEAWIGVYEDKHCRIAEDINTQSAFWCLCKDIPDILAADVEVPASIPGAARFSV
jgi:hypothetical protein